MVVASAVDVGQRIVVPGETAARTVFVAVPSRDGETVTIHFEGGGSVMLDAADEVSVEGEA